MAWKFARRRLSGCPTFIQTRFKKNVSPGAGEHARSITWRAVYTLGVRSRSRVSLLRLKEAPSLLLSALRRRCGELGSGDHAKSVGVKAVRRLAHLGRLEGEEDRSQRPRGRDVLLSQGGTKKQKKVCKT